MPPLSVDASPVSSPELEAFVKEFLVQHQQLVETVLRESCGNVIEAITRKTSDLMLQHDVAGCLRRSEPKLVFEPKLNSKPVPSVLGTPTSPATYTASDSGEGAGLLSSYNDTSLTPLKTIFSPRFQTDDDSSSRKPRVSIASEALDRERRKHAHFQALPSCVNLTRQNSINSSQSLVNKTKIRASLRKSILELSQDPASELKVERGVYAALADTEAMKEKLRLAITQTPYDVSDYYHRSGTCQAVAKSHAFEILTLVVIATNALWISIDVDLNDATIITDANPVFVVADNAFCSYFLFELLIRFGAFQVKTQALKDRWFTFDACMLVMMIIDTWLLPLFVLAFASGSRLNQSDAIGDTAILKGFRIVRLIRIARVLKILTALPELMVVIKGLFVATRAVSCTVILMLLIIYVFAITFRQVCAGTALGREYFNSVPDTMRYLLVLGTTPDLYDYVTVIWDESAFFALMFMVFILFVTITIMNMLVGVLVGVVNTVATVEKEQLMVHFVKDNLLSLLKVMHEEDADNDNKISKEEFRCLIQNADAIRSFTAMGVDVVGLVDLVDFIFQDDAYLDFPKFMDLVLQLRGTNQATVKDIVDLRRFITMEFNAFLHALDLIPPETELYQEVAKTITQTSSENLLQLHLTKAPSCGTMSLSAAAFQPPPASRVETGILQPNGESTEKSKEVCGEVAGEKVRKKKIKRKMESKPSSALDVPVTLDS